MCCKGGRCPKGGKGKEEWTPVASLHTVDSRTDKASQRYTGQKDQKDAGHTEHKSGRTVGYRSLRVGGGRLCAGWPVRLYEVGGSGGGVGLISFLTCCAPL